MRMEEGRDDLTKFCDNFALSELLQLGSGERQWLKACAKCDVVVIKRMLQERPELATFDTEMNQRYSALHFAAKRGHVELVQMLVGVYKFDVNKRTVRVTNCSFLLLIMLK